MTEDLLVKPSDGGKFGQDLEEIKFQSSPVRETRLERKTHMKRVKITVQPVQRSLCARRLLLNNSIRLALGRLIRSRGGSSIYLSPKGDRRNTKEWSSQFRNSIPDYC